MQRVNVSFDDNVLERVNIFCKKYGLSRSALITVSLNAYMDAQDALPTVQTQLDELKAQIDLLTLK